MLIGSKSRSLRQRRGSVSKKKKKANKEEKSEEGLNVSSAKAGTPPPAQPAKQAQEAENDDETNKDMPGQGRIEEKMANKNFITKSCGLIKDFDDD